MFRIALGLALALVSSTAMAQAMCPREAQHAAQIAALESSPGATTFVTEPEAALPEPDAATAETAAE